MRSDERSPLPDEPAIRRDEPRPGFGQYPDARPRSGQFPDNRASEIARLRAARFLLPPAPNVLQ